MTSIHGDFPENVSPGKSARVRKSFWCFCIWLGPTLHIDNLAYGDRLLGEAYTQGCLLRGTGPC